MPAEVDPQRAALERALGAQYEIMRLLGRGGMGAVYLARERALERAVAIKVLPPDAASDTESRERFRREARTAAKLTFPNIVPLHTFGEVEGMLYFVMGYVRGESLADRMRREGKLPEVDVRRILGEVADALAYAHRQGVVHRDIKPDNILLDEESGRPMLTDFGVAKARASGTTLTEAGAVVGTPHYMSPEQASGARDLDGRSDLYSLGVMGYAMLSGRLPFEGESFRDVIVQHVTKEPAPLAAVAPDAPPELSAAVMRCLAKEPARRWPDGQQLRAALDVTDSEEDLPVGEARVDVTGFWAVFGLWFSAIVGLGSYLFPSWTNRQNGPWWTVPAMFAAISVLSPVGVGLFARFKKVPWTVIRRRALSPPRWWPFWWPRRWRRPGDVWDRLPRALRWPRNVIGACVAWILIVQLPLLMVVVRRGEILEPLPAIVALLFTMWTVIAPWWIIIGAAAAPLVWARRRGISDDHYNRIAFAPTSRLVFWRRPQIAGLLLAPQHTNPARAAEPRSPEEYAQAIRDLVGQLPSGTRDAVSEAGDAAGQLLATLTALDVELAKLARDADPQELEAVENKLRALGPEAADEGEVRRQKRTLLADQRDLLRRLEERLAAMNDRRARLVDLLRTMWLQLANLRAETARDTLGVTEVSRRVKALCLEIDAQVQAAETVQLVLR